MSLAASFIAGVARLITGVQVESLAPLDMDRQTVYFANHSSHLDFVVLWSSLPKAARALTRPVAAQDYWSTGLRHRAAVDVFNAILVARKSASGGERSKEEAAAAAHDAIDHLIEGMGERHSLIIFPEGTRGSGEAIAPFKAGLYYLCKARPGLRLVPVYMANLNRILPKGEFLPVPLIGRVTFGEPMSFDPKETKEAFLTRAHAAVSELAK